MPEEHTKGQPTLDTGIQMPLNLGTPPSSSDTAGCIDSLDSGLTRVTRCTGLGCRPNRPGLTAHGTSPYIRPEDSHSAKEDTLGRGPTRTCGRTDGTRRSSVEVPPLPAPHPGTPDQRDTTLWIQSRTGGSWSVRPRRRDSRLRHRSGVLDSQLAITGSAKKLGLYVYSTCKIDLLPDTKPILYTLVIKRQKKIESERNRPRQDPMKSFTYSIVDMSPKCCSSVTGPFGAVIVTGSLR